MAQLIRTMQLEHNQLPGWLHNAAYIASLRMMWEQQG